MDIFDYSSQQVFIIIFENYGSTWLFFRIYVSTSYRERRVVWQEVCFVGLGHTYGRREGLQLCARAEDKIGGRPFVEDVASREFAQLLQINGLVDLEFVGPDLLGTIIGLVGLKFGSVLTGLFLLRSGSFCTLSTRFVIYLELLLTIVRFSLLRGIGSLSCPF